MRLWRAVRCEARGVRGRALAGLFLWVLAMATGALAQTTGDQSSGTKLAAAALPQWHELPVSVRRDLPPLKLTLLRWHEKPEARFVWLNELRVGEDGVAGQELWVREIRPDGIVIEFRDVHFFYPR